MSDDEIVKIIKRFDRFDTALKDLGKSLQLLKVDNKKIRAELKECKYHREKLYEHLVNRFRDEREKKQ